MQPWEIAINKLKKLFEEHRNVEDWSDNIIKASGDLKDPEDWRIFYMFLCHPQGKPFDPTLVVPTLGDMEKIPDIDPYEDGMECTYYKNGPLETTIHVKNTKFYAVRTTCASEDEKKEEVSTEDDKFELSPLTRYQTISLEN